MKIDFKNYEIVSADLMSVPAMTDLEKTEEEQ